MVITLVKVSGKLFFYLNTVIPVMTRNPLCWFFFSKVRQDLTHLTNYLFSICPTYFTPDWILTISMPEWKKIGCYVIQCTHQWMLTLVTESLSCWLKRFIWPQVPMIMKWPCRHEYVSFIPSMSAVLFHLQRQNSQSPECLSVGFLTCSLVKREQKLA